MASQLIKKQVVLSRSQASEFEAEDSGVYVDLSNDVWFEMGEPSTITVTIEPGDTLNG